MVNLFQMNHCARTFNHRILSVVIHKLGQASELVAATNVIKVFLQMTTNLSQLFIQVAQSVAYCARRAQICRFPQVRSGKQTIKTT